MLMLPQVSGIHVPAPGGGGGGPSVISREIARTLGGSGLTTTGASSTTNLAAATAGYVEYQFGVSVGNDWPVAGLREGAFPAGAFNFNLIQWGLLSLGTTVRVYENGVHAGGVTTTAAVGDVFAIERLADNSMRYLKNGVPFYTSAQNSSGGALEFGVNINESSGSIKNARWNDGTIIAYQNVTGMAVTDTAIEATDWSFILDSINTLSSAGDSGVLSGSATILNFDFFDNEDAIVVASYSAGTPQPLREYLLGTTSDIATTTNGAVESATTGGFTTFGLVESYPDGSHILVNQYTTTALYALPVNTAGTLAGTDFANIGTAVYTLPSADWASGNFISTGLALYGIDYIGETAYRTPLGVARDWDTAGAVTSRDFTAIIGANNCRGIAANSDESELIIATETNHTLYHFVMTTKGDLNSAVLTGSYQLPAANSTPGDICVRAGQVNVSDYTANIIYRYA